MGRGEKRHAKRREFGVGVVETILVIGLLVATSAVLLPLLTRTYGEQRSESAADAVRDALRETRSRARGNVGGASHGLYIATTATPVTLTLYRGNTYTTRAVAYDQIEVLESGATIGISPGDSDIHFSGSTGTTTPRSVSITAGGEQHTLEILSTGFVRYAQ